MRPTVSRDLWVNLGPVGELGCVSVLVVVVVRVSVDASSRRRYRPCFASVCVPRSRVVLGFASKERDEGNEEAVTGGVRVGPYSRKPNVRMLLGSLDVKGMEPFSIASAYDGVQDWMNSELG